MLSAGFSGKPKFSSFFFSITGVIEKKKIFFSIKGGRRDVQKYVHKFQFLFNKFNSHLIALHLFLVFLCLIYVFFSFCNKYWTTDLLLSIFTLHSVLQVYVCPDAKRRPGEHQYHRYSWNPVRGETEDKQRSVWAGWTLALAHISAPNCWFQEANCQPAGRNKQNEGRLF